MEKLTYTIADKTIAFLLGQNNFINEESALFELIKNAYDASASNVSVIFESNAIRIIDDGMGMDKDDVRKKWMAVGVSDKGYDIIDDNNNQRVLAGSKGVGRFALARLGNHVEMLSKKEKMHGVKWETDWNSSFLSDWESSKKGTQFTITQLNSKWTDSKIKSFIDYLSFAYNDSLMSIHVLYSGKEETIHNVYSDAQIGVNCLSSIIIDYNSLEKKIHVDIHSDEFLEEAKDYCTDIDLTHKEVFINAIDEIGDDYSEDIYEQIGDVSAKLFFYIRPTTMDCEKFLYKHRVLPEHFDKGVRLYRNAFCITPYDGNRDWLLFGARSRKSPAAATHPTGAWRVRENQISGRVIIDKKKNQHLKELANRQGLEEDVYYQLFVEIITKGIEVFENYRQAIIKRINVKNREEEITTPIISLLIKGNVPIKQLSEEQASQLVQELRVLSKSYKAAKIQNEDNEVRYKYDVRILNVLATEGLKASSIAHEYKGDLNLIEKNVSRIKKALQKHEMWDILCLPQNTVHKFDNVPNLLNQCETENQKLAIFLRSMLSSIEKKSFDVDNILVIPVIEQIQSKWKQNYGWVYFVNNIEQDLVYRTSLDVLQTIVDNLVLNSVQQNEKLHNLTINLSIKKELNSLFVHYSDNGKGLAKKYLPYPFKILEVHETTREDGHGLGMWIVNNTLSYTGGYVSKIYNDNGFNIEFFIGEKI